MPAQKTTRSRRRPDPFDLSAADVMQQSVITVRASDSLREAERVLAEARISGAPVVDDAGAVLGVLSLRDLARHRAEDGDLPEDADVEVFDSGVDDTEQVAFDRPASGACAADVMTQDLVSVAPAATLAQVAKRMVDAEVHRVLVLERGKLRGLVSSTDLLRVLAGAGRD